MSQVGLIDFEETVSKVDELENEAVPLFATSPGHTVFGEYVGAHWCGPCMSSASPSLTNLKTSNPEDFTFVEKIFSELWDGKNVFPLSEIVSLCRNYPEIVLINKSVSQKKGAPIKLKKIDKLNY